MHSSLVPLHLRAPGEVVFPMSIPQYLIYGEYIARFHIESSDFDIGDGNNFQFISKIIPDIVLTGTEAEVDYVLKTRNYPNDSLATEATATITASTQKAISVASETSAP